MRRRSLTYAEVLAHFGIKITPRRVYGLCRDLGTVCERNRTRGEPELAVLVVRKSDRLPGDGFFHGAWRDGSYDGPATGPRARAYIDALSAAVFAFWAEPRARGSAPRAPAIRAAPRARPDASAARGALPCRTKARAINRTIAPFAADRTRTRQAALPQDRHRTVTRPSRSLVS